jgi:hypothetical protein
MESGAIFEIVEGRLLSVRWDNELEDSFKLNFDSWQDLEYLENFFEKNKNDLSGAFWRLSIEEAVIKVLDEARLFESDILDFAENGRLDEIIFKSLRGANEREFKRVHSKAYSVPQDEKAAMLRIYAVRIGDNCYIVTGGAIKLTKAMQDREHTTKELKKLEIVSSYLKANGIEDTSDYGFIEIENK